MTLKDLFQHALGFYGEVPDVTVTGIAQDQRRVRPGFVFVARRGASVDGHTFVAEALDRGAVAVVGQASAAEVAETSWASRVPYVRVEHDRAAVAKLAATLHAHPSKQLFTLGVTGTDGKTTTSFLLHHLLLGQYPTGLLSTAGIKQQDEEIALEGHFTTPEASEVQGLLARFRDAGLSHAVVESSSHGFAQRRLDEIAYDIGVWTNLSAEHLDFHKTLAAYREAKLTLMRRAAVSILNADDLEFPHFAAAAQRVVSYGVDSQDAHWRAHDVEEAAGELRWQLAVNLEEGTLEAPATLPMIGRFNLYNALAALAAAYQAGLDLHLLLDRLSTFPGVPGRMQLVQTQPFAVPFAVVVDFAHTAPALAKALTTVRPQTTGRLIVMVGAAGGRDPGKRAPLGGVATQHADLAILTEEDSRSEDVAVILGQMAAGAVQAGGEEHRTFWRIPDRREAIGRAIGMARPGDLVLLAGKGHETTLERNGEVLPWDEVAEARRALNELIDAT